MTDMWRPACPCDADCLHTPAPQVSRLRAFARAAGALGVLLLAALAIPLTAPTSRRGGAVGRWVARGMLWAMGIRWSVVGAQIRPGALLVGNHVSWLDIVVMMAAGHERVRMVSKIEVSGWPVIGRLAQASRAIFVDRSKPKRLPAVVAQVAAALRDGDAVQVFPEGTTTCGMHPARWRPAFLQAALDAGAPVQRFTLLFSTQRAAFVDEETLLDSLWRVLRLRGLSVTVLVDEARLMGAANRRQLAAKLSRRLDERVHHGGRA